MPSIENFTQHKDLPKIYWRNQGKIGGGHYEKQNALAKLDEKICFVRLSPHTLQNLW